MPAVLNRRNAVLALGVLGASAAASAWFWRRREVRPESCGPLLAYHEAPNAVDAPTRVGDAAWLALMTLPPVDRDRMIELLTSLLTLVAARSTPALYDWISKDVQEEFAPVRRWLLPVTDSAKAVIQERWVAREVEVRVLADGAKPVEDEQVVSTWSSVAPAEEPARIARSVAWALTGSVLVTGLSRDERDRVGAALRSRIPVDDSPIAVVLDAELQARQKTPAALSALQRACGEQRKLIRSVSQVETRPLAALADATEEPLLPWLPLKEGELLIVPRQGAASKPAGLVREITGALGAAGADGRLVCAPRG